MNIVQKASKIIEDYRGLKNTHVDVERIISISFPSNWSSPIFSFKLNINAPRPIDNKWGAGVRDSLCFVLATATWNFEALLDANIAKVLGFWLPIQFVYNIGFRNIVVGLPSCGQRFEFVHRYRR